MKKNFFPESIIIDNGKSLDEVTQKVSTLDGKEISYTEDAPFTFSYTAPTYDVFNSRLIITLVEEL